MTVVIPPEALDALVDLLASRISESLGAGTVADEWLNSREAVSYLRLPSLDALHRLTARNAIPHSKVNGRCVFSKPELKLWLDTLHRGPARATRGV